ncbi:UDP-glycosyltransferase 91A1-like [Cornus florida]|uniref:UDP-glycosyltransferase 91A1-like n=1 Tax=Cornus florida TaxID=4283 RepID=UPI0028A0B090|nr:UDP-glycosyltransferase 91A1-like [Cornus florida]
MAETGKQLHIVMFPWLAFGHMLPFLELSKLIAQKGHKISFVSTPRNIDRFPKLPPDLAHLIKFVKLPLPQVQNLPENAESTSDLPYHKVKYLKMAYDLLQQPMNSFLEASAPDCVIYDFIAYWLGPIAAKLNILSCLFCVFIASALGYAGPASVLMDPQNEYRTKPEEFTVPPNWFPFKSTVAFRLFEILRIFDEVEALVDNVPAVYRLGAGIDGCDVITMRSCYEFEPEWLTLLGDIHRPKPVIPVGQLPPVAYHDDEEDDAWREMKAWLNKQSKGSVVYVAFGSEAKPSQAELTEIALGLELSELPFFWALRKQRGMADTEVIELPEGFEERTRGRGLVRTSWVPQLKILSHDSVGGFLTHSGWSSVVEAIQFARALILLTCLADQGLNARVLEEKKMGYSIPRDERDGSFTSDSVAESLRLVMVEEGGKIYRDKVKEMRGLFGDRDKQDKYVDNLLAHFQSHRKGGLKKEIK